MSSEVMVALDGSEKELPALSVGLALADLARSEVHLVRVIRAPSNRTLAQAEVLGVDEAAMTGRLDVEGQIAETIRRLTANTGRTVTWEVLEGTNVAKELIRYATTRDALVLVMGTRAPSSVGLALVGSVADRVLRDCPKPVVVVPPGAAYLEGKYVQFKRVVVPLDGSELAERSVDYLLTLPRATELEFVLLAVAHAADTIANAERRLRAVADRVLTVGAAAEARMIKSYSPVQAIAAATREPPAQLIAMSTRGTGGLDRLVLGSVAQGVVRAAEVPVLLITPAMLAKAGA